MLSVLYVVGAVLRLPQDCLREKAHSAVPTFLCACLVVGYAISFTSPTWFHVELGWM
jgi:hypothetical protein